MARIFDTLLGRQEEPGDDTPGHFRPVTERRGSWWFLVTAMAAAIFIGLGSLGLLWLLARAIAVFILGITLAAALYPITNRLGDRMPRVLAIAVVYILLFAILGLVIWLVVPPLAAQVGAFTTNLPKLIEKIQHDIAIFTPLSNVSLLDMLTTASGNIGSSLVILPEKVLSSVLDTLVVIFLSVYALIDLPEVQRYIHSFFPPDTKGNVDRMLERMARSMGGYVRGAVINGFIIGLLTYIGLAIIGVNFPLILGIIAGVLELVPMVGPIIAGIPMLLIAYSQAPTLALITLVYVLAMHQFEGHILVPNIMRSQTEVTQLFIIIALFAGYSIGGILGSLAAIPLAAAAWVFMDEIVAPPMRKQTGAPPINDETDGETGIKAE